MLLKETAIQQLKSQIVASDRAYDLDTINRAIDTATAAHEGQKRSSGEDYVCHPIAVAGVLVDLGMDTETIVAALLHDVVEDTAVELSDLKKQYGETVALLVDGVTKLNKLSFSSREEHQAENVRKMLLAMSEDIRVIIIKLADRLHNMRTIEALSSQKQRDIAKETMDIFAPLAHRLGIRAVKEELEDLSLRTLDAVGYREIENALAAHEHDRHAFVEDIQQDIKARLAENEIKAHLSGRVKSISGIYRKMYIQGRQFDEIYDVYAVRVIVDSVIDCYNVLGMIHDMFRPIPNRFKDYVSTPKPNMYQSLHTTVINEKQIPFEVQIRTWDMHYTAEYGIAAHWKYKLGIQKRDKLEERLAWVREFIENQKDVDDAQDIVRAIKTDLSSDDVFVFTPKGDVVNLPVGSTVIDFAYAIHTAVGNRMVGAKVDGRIVPLDYEVKMGQIVEVMTTSAAGHGPSRDWLNIVKTGEARNKIRSWFKKERREENIEQGLSDLQREASRLAIRLTEQEWDEFIALEAQKAHLTTADDFYAAIGYGGVLLSRVVTRMKEHYTRLRAASDAAKPVASERRRSHNGGVVVEGVDNCLVKFARCCNPVPGDDIVGFVTRGYGVSIHKQDCPNVPKDGDAARWVGAHWETDVRAEFKATIMVRGRNRQGLLADITGQLASMRIGLHTVNAREPQEDSAVITLTIGVSGAEHLQMVIARLQRVEGVDSITRTGG